jgi:hypothetical protein
LEIGSTNEGRHPLAASGNNGGGRRSKGDRRLIGTRVSVEYRDRAAVLAELRGLTMNDFLEDLIIKAVDEAAAAGKFTPQCTHS